MPGKPVLALAAPIAFLLASPASAELSISEQRMAEHVDSTREADFALLERIAAVNSGTHNHAGVRAVADMLVPEFEALGFETQWIDQSAAGRAGHLFARNEGTPGTTRMLLIAHLDTVFEPSSPFQEVTRAGDTLTGPGVGDDKGGIVIILSALKAMQAAGTLGGANIVVALTGDEEDAGKPLAIARADLVDAAQWADVALDFEGLSVMDGKDMGVIARRSSNSWTLTTTGREGHSSGVFGENAGYGAIYEMARILDAFRRELPEENLTYNPGLVVGGTQAQLAEDRLSGEAKGKTNIISPVAIARGDLRALTPEQTDRAVDRMQQIVEANLPGTDAQIEFEFRYPPMPPTEGNRAVLDKLNAVNADLGLGEMAIFPPARRGAGDINFIAEHVDGIAGMGPDGSGAHAPGESVDLGSFARQAKRAAILMSRLAREAP